MVYLFGICSKYPIKQCPVRVYPVLLGSGLNEALFRESSVQTRHETLQLPKADGLRQTRYRLAGNLYDCMKTSRQLMGKGKHQAYRYSVIHKSRGLVGWAAGQHPMRDQAVRQKMTEST